MNKVKSETAAPYKGGAFVSPVAKKSNNDIIEQAKTILRNRLKSPGVALTSPDAVKDLMILQLAELEHEVFCCVWLNNKNQVIAVQEMFRGTISTASVYPREVVKEGLKHNAAAVIFAHNHPSGNPEPSDADKRLTNQLIDALMTVDIRSLDHIIVGGTDTISFSEVGLI